MKGVMFTICKFFVGLIALCMFLVACIPSNGGTSSTQVFVHYMLVGNAKPFGNNWGFMWNMAGSCNPDKIDSSGRREICSKYYPSIGPYDYRDPAVLEYHVLLMKLSGVAGVMFDWYGSFPQPDLSWTQAHDAATLDMVGWLERAGLRFALVFEDSPFKDAKTKYGVDSVAYARDTLLPYMQKQYFSRNSYVRVQNRPLLLNWGPTVFQFKNQKEQIFSRVSPRPLWATLDWGSETADVGFSWTPNLGTSEGMDSFYQNYYSSSSNKNWSVRIASAYPGFDDFFDPNNSIGFRTRSLGHIDARGGQTFRDSLSWAKRIHPEFLQVVTWNDFAEGTMIEPTREFGTKYLQDLQGFTGVSFNAIDLELPERLFKLRKAHALDAKIMHILDNVFDLIVSGNVNQARTILREFE
jgi:hypothetical protein